MADHFLESLPQKKDKHVGLDFLGQRKSRPKIGKLRIYEIECEKKKLTIFLWFSMNTINNEKARYIRDENN